jgi:hypothetical protein
MPIFGEKLSPNATVEAIAAPVRLAGVQIGVVTLYGTPRSHELRRSQFYTTAIWLLEEAMNRFDALVGFLLDRQVAFEEAREKTRRDLLLDVLSRQRGRDSFERTVGDELVKYFRLRTSIFIALPKTPKLTNSGCFTVRCLTQRMGK